MPVSQKVGGTAVSSVPRFGVYEAIVQPLSAHQAKLMIVFDGLEGLFRLKRFCDSMFLRVLQIFPEGEVAKAVGKCGRHAQLRTGIPAAAQSVRGEEKPSASHQPV